MTIAELLHTAEVNQRVLRARLAVMEAQADFDLLMLDYGTGGGAGLRDYAPDWLTRRDILRGAIFGNGEEIALLKSVLATQAPSATPEPKKEPKP